jgi:hypothetical protein
MKTTTNQTIINGSLAAAVLALAGCAGSGGGKCPMSCSMTGSGGTPIEVTGVLGSPDATTTINGKQLPPPAPKFDGVIKDDSGGRRGWCRPKTRPTSC